MTVGRVASVALFELSLLICIAFLFAKSPARGFTLNPIRRDSINSQLSNPHDYSRFARSIARANRISTLRHRMDAPSDPETDLIVSSKGYLMNVSLGTPPFPILAIADIAEGLVWTQSKPCSKCYKQNAPLFDPTKSSTYKPVPCSAPECTTRRTDFNSSCDSSKKCHYSVKYVDQSSSEGTLATETVTLGPSKIPKIQFGCGFDNQVTFSEAGSGLIGLGNGRGL